MSLLNKIFPKPVRPEAEPIVAYRVWRLRESAEGIPVLFSSIQDFCWLPFAASAGDPDSESGGIYAFKNLDVAINTYYDSESIVGECSLWGTVIEYEEGYRAQFAYPKEFWVHDGFDAAMILRLEEAYGVPVLIKEEIPKAPMEPAPLPPPKFSYGGIRPGLVEVCRDVIFDREQICGWTIDLFTIPLGHTSGGAIKDWQRTNMLISGMLPCPTEFIAKAIRCVFFEPNGYPVPITDPIYWEASVRLQVNRKTYWHSPCAMVADPGICMAATDFSKIPAAERLNLLSQLSQPLTAPAGIHPSSGAMHDPIQGIQIRAQECFDVEIAGLNKWLGREVLVAIEGLAYRAVV